MTVDPGRVIVTVPEAVLLTPAAVPGRVTTLSEKVMTFPPAVATVPGKVTVTNFAVAAFVVVFDAALAIDILPFALNPFAKSIVSARMDKTIANDFM